MLSIVGNQRGMALHGQLLACGRQDGIIELGTIHSGDHRGMDHIGAHHGIMDHTIGALLSTIHTIARSIVHTMLITVDLDMIDTTLSMEVQDHHLIQQVGSLAVTTFHRQNIVVEQPQAQLSRVAVIVLLDLSLTTTQEVRVV